jgi:hypothetical protein
LIKVFVTRSVTTTYGHTNDGHLGDITQDHCY